MKVTKITIGRLFNLGSYEHVRYDITVELSEGDSAQAAMIGLEKIVSALAPERCWSVKTRDELKREERVIESMKHELAAYGEDEFRRRHGHFEGTPEDYLVRRTVASTQEKAKRDDYERTAKHARRLLDELGGAATWKDAKLDWEDDQYDEP
jgi:hypothetical protein